MIDSLYHCLSKMNKIGVNSATINSANKNARFTDHIWTLTNRCINPDYELNANYAYYKLQPTTFRQWNWTLKSPIYKIFIIKIKKKNYYITQIL
jgi:hypothetical protein